MLKKAILTIVAVVAIVVVVVLVRGDVEDPPPPPDVRTTGPWVDRILISQELSEAAGVARLEAADIDIWWMLSVTDPQLYDRIMDYEDLRHEFSYGHFTELMFNVAGPYFYDGSLNPFHDAEIREAFNWLIDRDYFIGDFLGGMGRPIYALDGREFPEYARYPDVFEAIEDYYEHDPDRAREIIHNRMEALGAELVDGTWHYDGDEIKIRFIIRTDLYPPLYPEGGDYIAGLMEWVGLNVERMLLPFEPAVDIWRRDDPFLGTYHAVTGGWRMEMIHRDKGYRFYTSDTRFVRSTWPRWLTLEPPEEYVEIARRLYDRDYDSMEEREQLFEEALWMRMEFSPQIVIADIAGVNPWRANLDVRTDLSAGFGWGVPQTLHFVDEDGDARIGGTVEGAQYVVLAEPWNPVDGTAAAADLLVFREMLQERGLMPDGRDGLVHPWRIERAEVTVREGLPVVKTHDWVSLDFAADIQAHPDAWVDWDAVEQRFITVGERMDPGSPYYDEDFDPDANVRSVAYYPDDLYQVPMHDGSTLSLADFIMAMIVRFDRAKPDSVIYDEGEVSRLETFMGTFRGVRILSEDPLVIESYSKAWDLDAEMNVSTWFPAYGGYNQFAPWHVITIGKKAETVGALAWGRDKSTKLNVDWMDYTMGPSLPILRTHLHAAIGASYIPYEPTMGQYLTAAEAAARYANLREWDQEKGHFWTTTAPFYLANVSPTLRTIDLRRFEDHPDPIDRWVFLLEDL